VFGFFSSPQIKRITIRRDDLWAIYSKYTMIQLLYPAQTISRADGAVKALRIFALSRAKLISETPYKFKHFSMQL